MSSSNDEECVVCCRKFMIYAIGSCDHTVCYECSARMRVLCETNECPICRSDMPVVLFTRKLKPFLAVNKKFTLLNKKYQILFEDQSVLKEFEFLLEYRCSTCSEVFPNFDKLKDHNRRKHELHYCELCTENLKIFPFERKSYSRKDLARHKRLGDPDLTSHQGHPLCKFCDERYVDSDDLFRHLRRDHFFCYFCDADGKNQYYSNYDELRVHFRKDHYLCEEGDCAQERFTSAFRTDIDLKSHRATHHCKNKSDARQTRMLDLEFNYVPLTRPSGSSSPRGGRYGQYRKDRRERNVEENETRGQRPNYPMEVENINTQSVQEFPYLCEDGVAANGHSGLETKLNSLTLQSYNKNPNPYRKNYLSADQFPALGSKSNNSAPYQQANSAKPASSSRGASATNQKSTFAQNFSAASNDQKAKGAESKSGDKTSKNSKWLNSKSKPVFDDEFPMLTVKNKAPSTSAPVTAASSNSNFVHAVKNIKEPEPKPLPEFLVVKSKSKKKKQVVIPKETEQKEEPVVTALAEPVKSAAANDESTNRFKSHMIHPVLAKTSLPYTVSDTWEEKVSFGNADFPPLDAPSAPPKKPPGFKNPKARAPPGFSQSSSSNSEPRTKPLTLSAVADILKQSQSKVNGVESSNQHHVYMRPPNFDQRNQDLIIKITTLPGHDKESFQEFKQMSGSFRANHISAAVFHNKCLEILGRCAFQDIFAELVTLLPDISKQQELLAVHYKYLWDKDEGSDYYPIVSCSICNQVLMNRDEKYHRQMHESSQ